MPTYGEYASKRELATRRAGQDAVIARQHAEFNLSAQDRHMKYERPHFAVVGEGSREATSAYAAGYERINWGAA